MCARFELTFRSVICSFSVSDLTRALPKINKATVIQEHGHTLNMVERYLRIINHLTLHSEKLQRYLTGNRNGALLNATVK